MFAVSHFATVSSLPFGPFSLSYDEGDEALFEQLLSGKLTGTVHCDRPVPLQDGAVLEVRLLDISIADSHEVTLARQAVIPAEQLPMDFELAYDRHDIRRGHTYSVSATIRTGGRLIYANVCPHLVFTGATRSHLRVQLKAVGIKNPALPMDRMGSAGLVLKGVRVR